MSKQNSNAVTKPDDARLPEPVARRGIDEAQWRTLATSLYPGAKSESILMAIDYCRARRLDPLKKPCHIVPMRVKNAKTGEYEWRDVILPGIYEYRTTAMRTGLYLGHSRPEYGPDIEHRGVTAPEWCELTVFRWSKEAQQRIEFPVRVLFRESAVLTKDGKVNDRWGKAPMQMLTKCAEAAALREAFPDEFGGEPTYEEMEGREIDAAGVAAPHQGKPRTQPPRAITRQAPTPSQIKDVPPITGEEISEAELAAMRAADAEIAAREGQEG